MLEFSYYSSIYITKKINKINKSGNKNMNKTFPKSSILNKKRKTNKNNK